MSVRTNPSNTEPRTQTRRRPMSTLQSSTTTRGAHTVRPGTRAVTTLLLGLTVVLAACATRRSNGPGESNGSSSAPANYADPAGAVAELIAALRPYDEAKVRAILGAKGQDLLSSSDDVADKNQIREFLAAYDARHSLVEQGDETVLVVGQDDWPLPIPLIRGEHGWAFDVERGADEILSRRIGANELNTIEVCRAICDAQNEYAAEDRDGRGAGAYASKIVSTPGQRDGLYWPETDRKTPSPLGQLVAEASAKGYGAGTGSAVKREPYHGYYYRLLDQQGDAAPGGAMQYVEDGRMTRGFAVIAEPAEYGSSGVMTFLVSARGIVYQCDLGEDTAKVAAAVKSFDPDDKWAIVRD